MLRIELFMNELYTEREIRECVNNNLPVKLWETTGTVYTWMPIGDRLKCVSCSDSDKKSSIGQWMTIEEFISFTKETESYKITTSHYHPKCQKNPHSIRNNIFIDSGEQLYEVCFYPVKKRFKCKDGRSTFKSDSKTKSMVSYNKGVESR